MNAPIPCTLSLPPDLIARIDEVAAADDRSRSAVVRRVLQQAFADDAALRAEAAARFQNLQSTPGLAPPAAASGASGIVGCRTGDAVVEPAPAASGCGPISPREAAGDFPE